MRLFSLRFPRHRRGSRARFALAGRTLSSRTSSPRHPLVAIAGALALVSVLGAAQARAACTPDTPPLADGGSVTCTGTDSTGFQVGNDPTTTNPAVNVTVTVSANADVSDSDATGTTAIGVNDDSTVTVEANARVFVNDTTPGFGIRGLTNSTVNLSGAINVQSDGSRGVSIGSSTTGPLATSQVNVFTGSLIDVTGNNAIAIESSGDASVQVDGRIDLNGLAGQGIVMGNRSLFDKRNTAILTGTINVGDGTAATDGAIGIRAGDNWFPNDIGAGTATPDFTDTTGSRVVSTGTINVMSPNGFGMRLGDDANLANNNNSIAVNSGRIDVTAANAVGISVGGNDFAPPADATLDQFSVLNLSGGTIAGTGAHGALIEFRANGGSENRLINEGFILADTMAAGVFAIVGSTGVERISNRSRIDGDVDLRGGDDIFEVGNNSTYNGTINGGPGADTLRLQATTALRNFDLMQLQNFEALEIAGGSGWSLANGGGFTGVTTISDGGRLEVPTPISLGGDFTVMPTGTLVTTIDPSMTPALTIAGTANLDGTLVVNNDPSLTPNTYPLITAGTINGNFTTVTFSGASSLRQFTLLQTATTRSVLLEVLSFSAAASNPNQRAVASYLVGIDTATGVDPALANLITDLKAANGATINNAFDALSPEAYDAQTSVLVEGGRRISNLLLRRPRECEQGELEPWAGLKDALPCHARRWAPWVAATGSIRKRDEFLGHAEYDAALGGVVFGVDAKPIGGLDLTLALATQSGRVDFEGAGDSTVTMTDLSGHASYTLGPVRAQGVISWGHGFHDDKRAIRIGGTARPVTLEADGDHDSDRVTLAAEIGAEIKAGPFDIEPLVGVDWAWVNQRTIRESGAGPFGLEVAARDDSIGSVSAGARIGTVYHHTKYLSRRLDWMDGVWRPNVDVRWRQMLAGEERELEARLLGAPASTGVFQVDGKEDDGGFDVGAGLTFVPEHANRLQIDFRYNAFVGSHTLDHDLTFRVALGF